MKKNSQTKLLEAGIIEFAKSGYTGASTRDIANKAGLNISAITYYYGSKKGLYEAVLYEITKSFISPFNELLYRYNNIDNSKECPKTLLKEFFAMYLEILTREDNKDALRKIFFAEYFKPSPSFNILYDNTLLPFYNIISEILIKESDNKMSIQEAYLSTFPLISHITVFGARKKPLCKLVNWESFGNEEKAMVLKSICSQVDSISLDSKLNKT